VRFNLKTAFIRSGASQRRAAVVCGIPENRLSEIVQGLTNPRPDEKARIAACLGVAMTEIDELFAIDTTILRSAMEVRSRR